MLRLTPLVAAIAFASPAFAACVVTQKHPIPNCPAVTYSPEDCDSGQLFGRIGDHVTSPAAIHVMTSGHSYYCPSHEGCIEMKDMNFSRGCVFTNVPRKFEESKEYASHIFVGDKDWSKEIKR
jgi:hypothetical protein